MNTNLHFIDKKAHLNVKNIRFVGDFTVHRKGNNKNMGEFVCGDLISNFNMRVFLY